MRLISANVNGIRAAHRRGGLSALHELNADIITLQEVRASREQLTELLDGAGFAGWRVVHAAADAAGRAGVAVLSRHQFACVATDFEDFPGAGRWCEAQVEMPGIGPVTVASAYVHTGEADTPKQDEKMEFLAAMTARMSQLRDELAIITGDFNVAHSANDLKNWKGNRGKAGFLPQEQAVLTEWLDAGWVDVTRRQAGEVPGPYTWWSWRGKAFDNDSGWRIDYALHSPRLAPLVESVLVGRAPSYAERWSDHAPLIVEHRTAALRD